MPRWELPLADLHLLEIGQHLNAPLQFSFVNNQLPIPFHQQPTSQSSSKPYQADNRNYPPSLPTTLQMSLPPHPHPTSLFGLLVLQLLGCSHLWRVTLLHQQLIIIITDHYGLFHLPNQSAPSSCLQGLLQEQKRHLLVPATIATSCTLVDGLNRFLLFLFFLF